MRSSKSFPLFIVSTLLTASLFAVQTDTPSVQQINIDDIFERQILRMQKMQEQMDKMFEEFDRDFYNTSFHSAPLYNRIKYPNTSSSALNDKGTHYEITLVHPKDSTINITAKNHQLTIQITQERHTQNENKEGKATGYASSSSIQSFSLPLDADTAAMKSKVEKESLIISIPKISKTQNMDPVNKLKEGNTTQSSTPKHQEINSTQPASAVIS